MQALCEERKIIRYEKGVYYIPTKTVFGDSILNPRKVIEKKYIKDGDKIIGYYSGITFQNQLKLTTQMPNVIEVYTNNETAKIRDVFVGKQKVILRKARTTINNDNVAVLSFLELMNDITPVRWMIAKKHILSITLAPAAFQKMIFYPMSRCFQIGLCEIL